ncbi:MAG: hypothetical protein HY721_22925 [Planctomycetes bacterium]|nr:hypothetical protein [Planctomycetota bacterium]
MPPTSTNAAEEILEKKDAAPVATACLIIACVALLGAIAFQLIEVAEYRRAIKYKEDRSPGEKQAKEHMKDFHDKVQGILAAAPAGAAEGTEEAGTPEEPATGDEGKAEPEEKTEDTTEKGEKTGAPADETKTQEPADEKTDEKTDGAADEKDAGGAEEE